jgi:hypothetical protein
VNKRVELWNAKGKDATRPLCQRTRRGCTCVRILEELPTVFDCSVLTFECNKDPS